MEVVAAQDVSLHVVLPGGPVGAVGTGEGLLAGVGAVVLAEVALAAADMLQAHRTHVQVVAHRQFIDVDGRVWVGYEAAWV